MEYKDKTQLLVDMHREYTAFCELWRELSAEQLTVPGANDAWSIKDNLAHLSAWHQFALEALRAVQKGVAFSHPWQGMDCDEISEYIYQSNKDRSLTSVRSEFRSTYQLLRDRVAMMTGEELNQPYVNSPHRPWRTVASVSYEHYREHSELIQNWLARQSMLMEVVR